MRSMGENLKISNYLNEVLLDWQGNRDAFPKNVHPKQHWPIPFFGKPTTSAPSSAVPGFAASDRLNQALTTTSTVRAEQVARAKALLADPNFPSQKQMEKSPAYWLTMWAAKMQSRNQARDGNIVVGYLNNFLQPANQSSRLAPRPVRSPPPVEVNGKQREGFVSTWFPNRSLACRTRKK